MFLVLLPDASPYDQWEDGLTFRRVENYLFILHFHSSFPLCAPPPTHSADWGRSLLLNQLDCAVSQSSNCCQTLNMFLCQLSVFQHQIPTVLPTECVVCLQVRGVQSDDLSGVLWRDQDEVDEKHNKKAKYCCIYYTPVRQHCLN